MSSTPAAIASYSGGLAPSKVIVAKDQAKNQLPKTHQPPSEVLQLDTKSTDILVRWKEMTDTIDLLAKRYKRWNPAAAYTREPKVASSEVTAERVSLKPETAKANLVKAKNMMEGDFAHSKWKYAQDVQVAAINGSTLALAAAVEAINEAITGAEELLRKPELTEEQVAALKAAIDGGREALRQFQLLPSRHSDASVRAKLDALGLGMGGDPAPDSDRSEQDIED